MSFDQFDSNASLGNSEETEPTLTPEQERKSFDGIILQNSLDISGMHIPGYEGQIEVVPGCYNTNNGVIVANIEGKTIAIPYNEKTLDWIRRAELREDEAITVPALNHKETWGDREDLFRRWADVHQKFQ